MTPQTMLPLFLPTLTRPVLVCAKGVDGVQNPVEVAAQQINVWTGVDVLEEFDLAAVTNFFFFFGKFCINTCDWKPGPVRG